MVNLKKQKTINIGNAPSEVRANAAWKMVKASRKIRYADYYLSKYRETIEQTEKKAKSGDDNAILQLIEWDKIYLSERFVTARISLAEAKYLVIEFDDNYRNEGKRFLQRLSFTVKKIAQCPKLKKYWNLLIYLRKLASVPQFKTVDALADYARNHHEFKENSPEEALLTEEKWVTVRFIKTHKHFIGCC